MLRVHKVVIGIVHNFENQLYAICVNISSQFLSFHETPTNFSNLMKCLIELLNSGNDRNSQALHEMPDYTLCL